MQNIKMMSRSFVSCCQRLGDKFTADSFTVKQVEGTEERDRQMTLWGSMLRNFNRSAHLSYSEDRDRFLLLNVGRYTGCPGRNVKNFGRVLLMLKYTDITQNIYTQS
jgi:hypothetical protein